MRRHRKFRFCSHQAACFDSSLRLRPPSFSPCRPRLLPWRRAPPRNYPLRSNRFSPGTARVAIARRPLPPLSISPRSISDLTTRKPFDAGCASMTRFSRPQPLIIDPRRRARWYEQINWQTWVSLISLGIALLSAIFSWRQPRRAAGARPRAAFSRGLRADLRRQPARPRVLRRASARVLALVGGSRSALRPSRARAARTVVGQRIRLCGRRDGGHTGG